MGGLSAARTVKSWKDEYGRTGIVGGMLVLALLIGFELVWYFFYCPVEDECQTQEIHCYVRRSFCCNCNKLYGSIRRRPPRELERVSSYRGVTYHTRGKNGILVMAFVCW